MTKKGSLILVAIILAFSIAGCGNAKSDDNAKADSTTSAIQKTEQAVTEAKNEESSKLQEVSSEAVTVGEEKDEITSSNADAIASANFTNDEEEAIANELVKNFGRRTLSKGDVIDLRDYCDWDSFSSPFKGEFLTGIGNDIELNYEHDLNSPIFTFNVYDEADMVFVVGVSRRGSHHLSAYVKK